MEALTDYSDAKTLAGDMEKPCLIPLTVTEKGLDDPSCVFLGLRKKHESAYLLESMGDYRSGSRYSIIGCGSLLHLKFEGLRREVDGRSEIVSLARERLRNLDGDSDSLEAAKKALFIEEMDIFEPNLPRYILGVTGYLSYDFIRERVGLEKNSKDDLGHPLLEFVLPESVIVFDHQEERTYYSSLMLLAGKDDFEKVHSESLSNLRELTSRSESREENERKDISIDSNFERGNFEKSVERIKEYIRAGDIIQTVISRRLELNPSPDLGVFYKNLREINPSPYMFFLDFPGQAVVGSSPEALVRVQGRKVMTRPIAGTRRRGENEEDDLALEEELLEDEKERAEHIMLVDLGRNDIGRVSGFGSVETPEFMEIEKYGDVQHIVSTVTGELEENADAFDALRSVFPAGTVTGAPKVRAMEIIEELEPNRRGIYSGAVGSISYSGDADFAIAIRTLTSSDQKAHVQVGAGIVADSDPVKEFYETQNKARSLLRAAGVESEGSGHR